MPRFLLSAWYVCHDLRFSSQVSLEVERDTPPTEAETIVLLRSAIRADLLKQRGEEGAVSDHDISGLTVKELPAMPADAPSPE